MSTLSLGSALIAPPEPHSQAHDPAHPPSVGRHFSPYTHSSFLPDSEATQRALTSGIPEYIIQRARESQGTDQPTSSAVFRAAREIGRENRRGGGPASYSSRSPDEGEASRGSSGRGRGRGRGLQVPGAAELSTASPSPQPPRLTLSPPARRARSASNSSHGSRVPSPLSRQVFPDDIETQGDDADAEGTETE